MNENKDYEQLLLDFIQRPNYQPVKLRVIAKKLELLDEEKQLKRALKNLIKQNQVAFGVKHLVRPVAGAAKAADPTTSSKSKLKTSESSNEIIGVFRRNAAGFGFVTPQASTATDRSDDIFIPAQKTIDAADLDLVRVRLSRGHRGGRGGFETAKLSGHIVEVIERSTHRFVGTYAERGGLGIVIVDAGVFETGILVGDASAKNGRVGDKVVIEMVRFPSSFQEGEAVIVEILGERGKAGVDTLTVIRQFDLPEEFPEPVLENARQQATLFDDSNIPEGRTDFTQATVITIDPATARDFDDAISLEKLPNGHWLLGVHIADVSHFVPRKTELEDEAYQRATSIYLPDRVIPMLPEIISNNLASLQPNRLRYTMTAMMELNEAGIPIHTELHRGVIKSAHRFTYEEIDEYLANDEPWREKLTPAVFDLVRNMHTLAMTIRRRRMKAGAINLVLPEVRIDLDSDGRVSGAHTEDNTESHQVIEEFMLAANIAVAQWLADQKLHLLRRVHANPSETKTAELTAFIHGLGLSKANLQDRFELKRIVEQSADSPQQHAIHYAVLRSMPKAVYSPEEIGHYALNADIYCHFTSPIRRYPDLVIHRMVGDILDGKKPDANFQRLAQVGKHCSNQEKRAAEAERELVKLKLLNFMSDKVGKQMHARITGVEAFGVFAQGVEIPAEGLIPLAKLPDDTYQYDRATRTLSGHKRTNQFRLGDLIEVEVVVVNPDRRILEFKLMGVMPSSQNILRRGHRLESAQVEDGHATVSTPSKPKKKRVDEQSKTSFVSSPPLSQRSSKPPQDRQSRLDEDFDLESPELEADYDSISDDDSDSDHQSGFDPEAFVKKTEHEKTRPSRNANLREEGSAGGSRGRASSRRDPPGRTPDRRDSASRGSKTGSIKGKGSSRDRTRRTPSDRPFDSRPPDSRSPQPRRRDSQVKGVRRTGSNPQDSERSRSSFEAGRPDSPRSESRRPDSSRSDSRRPDSKRIDSRTTDSRRASAERPGSRTKSPRSGKSSSDKPLARSGDSRQTDSNRSEYRSSKTDSRGSKNSNRPNSRQADSGRPDSRDSRMRDSNRSDSKPIRPKPMGSKPMGSKPTGSKPTGSKPMGSKPIRSKPMGSKRMESKEFGPANSIGSKPGRRESSQPDFDTDRQEGFETNPRDGRLRTGRMGAKPNTSKKAPRPSSPSGKPKRESRSGPPASANQRSPMAKRSRPLNSKKRNPKKR